MKILLLVACMLTFLGLRSYISTKLSYKLPEVRLCVHMKDCIFHWMVFLESLPYLGLVTNFMVQFLSWSCYNYSFT